MKLPAAVIAAIALIGTPAVAAPAALAPVYSWTGWYVGGNVGYGWGNADTDLVGTGNGATFCPTVLCPPPSLQSIFPFNIAAAGENTARLKGVIGGGQVGYNFQTSPIWVVGFEADIQASGQRGSNNLSAPFSSPACIQFNGTATCAAMGSVQGAFAPSDARIEWFGTVRGRLGYLITDQVLLYGTGGLAYGEVKAGNILVSSTLISGQPIFASPTPFPYGPNAAGGGSRTNVGWTAGAGIEGNFAYWLPEGWTWKLEYLYLDLGLLDTLGSFVSAPPGGIYTGFASPLTGTATTHTYFTDNIFRVGLNYKFH
jgi:outer membrane immunogenic protein